MREFYSTETNAKTNQVLNGEKKNSEEVDFAQGIENTKKALMKRTRYEYSYCDSFCPWLTSIFCCESCCKSYLSSPVVKERMRLYEKFE